MFKKIFENKLNKERLFLVAIITMLVIIWFHKGLILGSGESGLPFYNSSKLMELTSNNWTDAPLGTSGAIGSASYPFYVVIVFLQSIGIPSFLLQALLYWFIFVIGTLAVHKIASIVPENLFLTRFSSALFYIFNPVVHVSVLHRLQYPLMFFYGFMPFAFLIYYSGLQARKFIHLIFLGLLSVVFSFAFIGIESTEMLFGVLFLVSLKSFISSFKQKKDWFPLFYFFVFVIIFISINTWWLVPLFSSVVDLGSGGSVKYFSIADNVGTYNGIGEQIESVLNIFRLFKPNDFSPDSSAWVWIYGTIPFVILSFFSIIAFIIGLFKNNKGLLYKLLILLSLIVIFWSKGPLPPFGGINLYFFQTFTFLQVFRNPIEKAGLMLPFAMAIPIGFGMAIIINYLAKKLKIQKKIIAFVVLLIVFPVYMFPILTGLVFTGGPPPANDLAIGQYVKVPEYYKSAREWLDKQGGLFRILVLPLAGEGMTYKWDYGYAGVELSNNLFNHSMISFNTSQAFLPEIILNIIKTFSTYPEKIKILAQILNVKYIMLRDDIDYIARGAENPAVVLNSINNNLKNQFLPAADFGKLKFFELQPTDFQHKIIASVSPILLIDPLGRSFDLIPFSPYSDHDLFITSSDITQNNSFEKFSKSIVINGSKVENIDINTKNPVENLPFVSVYRDTPFYALVRLKEELTSQFQDPDAQLSFKVNISGKRLVEIDHSSNDVKAIDEYLQLMQTIGQDIVSSKSIDRAIVEVLLYQRQVLEGIKQKTDYKDKINKITVYLDNLFINIGARSAFSTHRTQIYRFIVPKDSVYEVLISKEDWERYYQDAEIKEFDLDGKIIKPDISKEQTDKYILSLGSYALNNGVHEVSIDQPKTVNQIIEELPEELVLSSQEKEPLTRVIPISGLNENYSYMLSFEYLEEKGNVPVIMLNTDVDPLDKKGERIPKFGVGLTRSDYDFGWKSYSAKFLPVPSAKEYELTIKIIPFGDCKVVVERPYRRYCEDKRFNQRYLKDSSSRLRNIRVEKIFNNQVMLREIGTTIVQNSIPDISFEKISPARYKVKVDAKNPFFLTLSTTFDPRWRAYFTTPHTKSLSELLSGSITGEMLAENNHLLANGYANAWYIEKTGSFDMFLEYFPERAYVIGRKFSVGAVIIVLLIAVSYIYKMIRKYKKE